VSLDTARLIAERVRAAGGRALIVGGWVRDQLLNRPNKDVDIEVYGLPAELLKEVLEGLGPVNTVGESFTVYKVSDVDVSSRFRGHRGSESRSKRSIAAA
jgi:tRNA nucleotidyltransferase (CCA-adding enzyme)